MDGTHHNMVQSEYSAKEVVKFVLVLTAITVASVILAAVFGSGSFLDWLRWFMGVFFLTFSSFKLAGLNMFAEMFAGYDVVARRIKAYAYAFPFIELALGIMYVADAAPMARDAATLVIMAVSSIGVAQEIKRRTGIHCACLGNIIKLPLSTVSLVEDVGMGLMAAAMLWWR